MKYKVSVIKKIAFLVMTMALAVAMVACSGAVGKPGEAGEAAAEIRYRAALCCAGDWSDPPRSIRRTDRRRVPYVAGWLPT